MLPLTLGQAETCPSEALPRSAGHLPDVFGERQRHDVPHLLFDIEVKTRKDFQSRRRESW